MKKLTSLLLALVMLFTALTLSGCPTTQLDIPITIRVSSDVETFPIDSVVLDMEYGLHKLTLWGTVSDDPKSDYPIMENAQNNNNIRIDFAIYVTEVTRESVQHYPDFKDVENLPEHTFVKMIKEEEAFTQEYGYREAFLWFDTQINHKEQIKIPAEYFSNEDVGMIWIRIFIFYRGLEAGDSYYRKIEYRKEIMYNKIDENTVALGLLD